MKKMKNDYSNLINSQTNTTSSSMGCCCCCCCCCCCWWCSWLTLCSFCAYSGWCVVVIVALVQAVVRFVVHCSTLQALRLYLAALQPIDLASIPIPFVAVVLIPPLLSPAQFVVVVLVTEHVNLSTPPVLCVPFSSCWQFSVCSSAFFFDFNSKLILKLGGLFNTRPDLDLRSSMHHSYLKVCPLSANVK